MNQDPLISAGVLSEKIKAKQKGLKVFTVVGSWNQEPEPDLFDLSFIPGSSLLSWSNFFLEHMIPFKRSLVCNEDTAKSHFAFLGINDGDEVILYDRGIGIYACRIWWALQYFGFTNVKVLDGGYNAWLRSDLDISKKSIIPNRGSFVPVVNDELLTSTEEISNENTASHIVDTRKGEFFLKGHIQGAINLSFARLIDDRGLFISDDDIFNLIDLTLPSGWENRNIISTCQTGFTATMLLLALQKIGITDFSLHDGSFEEFNDLRPDLVVNNS